MSRLRLAALVFSCLALWLRAPATLAQSASLDPPRVYTGDVTRLHIELESPIPSLYALDTEALEMDFEVLRKESRINRITDRQQAGSRMEWDLELAPRRAGILVVPPLRLGEYYTEAVSLEVVERNRAESGAEEVSVRLEFEPPNPYPGQQVNLTLSLLHVPPVLGGRWRDPLAEPAKILYSGLDQQQTLQIEGRSFHRSSRSMALFAERPGALPLSRAAFVGVIAAEATRDPAGLYPAGSLRKILRQSEPMQLEIRPIPADFTGDHWLPAQALELSQSWELPEQGLAVGDTLQRTLTIDARGLPAEVLPEDLLAGRGDSLQVYPDRAIRGNRFENGQIIGRLHQSYALLLTRAGEVELPAVQLSWWDVVADRVRIASLPGRRVRVAAGEGLLFDAVAGTAEASRPDISMLAPNPAQKLVLVVALLAAYLFWLASGAAVARFLRRRLELIRARRHLARACRQGRPRTARAALLAWARLQCPGESLYGLTRLRRRLSNAEFDAALRELDAALYAPRNVCWEGHRLWRSVRSLQIAPPPTPVGFDRCITDLYPPPRAAD